MCTVSNVGDSWGQTFPDRYPWWPIIPPGTSPQAPNSPIQTIGVDPEEFRKLKKEVEELKKLLLAAKEFDAATGQPDCEMDEKVDLIRRVAEAVGVDVEEVFGKQE